MVKVAFYSAALGDVPFRDVAAWAGQAGFDGIEIDVARHIKDPGDTTKAIRIARDKGLEVCALTVFGNLLDQDGDERDRIRDLVRTIATKASREHVPAVVVFPGRNETLSEDENYRDIAEFLDSPALHQANTTRILIENWPGRHKNFVATTPQGWRKLFSFVKSPNVGLEMDPSHLIWQGIDPLQVVTEFRERIFIVHGKDTKLFTDRIQDVGYSGNWWEYRLPGRGELDWRTFLEHFAGQTQSGRFVSVEHEDAEFGWPSGPVALRQEGLLKGLNALRKSLTANSSLVRG